MGRCVVTVKEGEESVVVDADGDKVIVSVTRVRGAKVSLAIGAPRRWRIRRELLKPPASAADLDGDPQP